MVAIAPGMFLAHKVVPSSGSTAISTCGPALMPTFSPMNSIGASSRSPSPITTVPSIGSLLSSRRIASTAAWSAAFSSPRPRSRAADTAARSVTRTISSDRMRSSRALSPPAGAAALSLGFSMAIARSITMSALLDPDDLRGLGQHSVALDRGERAPHRVLGGGIGDEHDQRRLVDPARIVPAMGPAVAAVLHDRFERDRLVRHAARDRGGGAGPIDYGQAD